MVANNNRHCFPIGTEVVIKSQYAPGKPEWHCVGLDKFGEWSQWWVLEDDMAPCDEEINIKELL